MRLAICRHAEAVDVSGALGDDGRWLTAIGRRHAFQLGERLKTWEDMPDHVFTSPLVRAVQTADNLAAGLGYEAEILPTPALSPDGTLSDLLDLLIATATRSAIVVGHEPQMGEWTGRLLGLPRFPAAFERAALVAIDFPGAPQPGTGRLVYMTTPRHPERFVVGRT